MLTAETAYQFLKPSLEELSEKEKAELCKLINGEPEGKKDIEVDARLKRIASKKRKLLKTGLFKN